MCVVRGFRGCDYSCLIKFSEMQEGISEEEAACAKIQKLERAFIWVITSLSVLQLLMGRASGQRHHLSLMSVPWLPSWELGTNMIS